MTAKAQGLMSQLRADLEALARIPSVSVPGRVDQPLLDAFEMTSRLFADAGVTVDRLDLPDTAPVVTGTIPAPPGAPTVLLYSHYDVVPAGGYRFGDYWKLGLPLLALFGVVAILLVPVFWAP